MKIKEILNGLSAEQRKQEKVLRAELYRELRTHKEANSEIGRRLLQLHDELIGAKKFKGYVECLGIPRRSAYRWMEMYKMLASLPETVLRAAEKRKMFLDSENYRNAIKAIPCPENPPQGEAEAWLDAIEALQKERAGKSVQSPDPTELQPEQRSQLTSQVCSKHCKQLRSFIGTYWAEIPAEERSIEVAQAVMGVTAAKMGITKAFTVIPNDHPDLVERLEGKTAQQEEVEEEVAA